MNAPLDTSALNEATLTKLAAFIHERFGIYVTPSRFPVLSSQLATLCRKQGIASFQALERRLQERPDAALMRELAEAVSVNHTAFMREAEVLDIFRRKVVDCAVPGTLQRIWSAASSTGEEAYTLAMMACERFGVGVAQSTFAILGTDISNRCVEQAERGIFDRARARGIPPALRQKYLKPLGMGQYQMIEPLRKMCLFRRLNLKLKPWPFSCKFDVIFCRNVLYYFDDAQQADIVGRMHQCAKPHGWLFTGVTEPIRGLGTGWQTVGTATHRKGAI